VDLIKIIISYLFFYPFLLSAAFLFPFSFFGLHEAAICLFYINLSFSYGVYFSYTSKYRLSSLLFYLHRFGSFVLLCNTLLFFIVHFCILLLEYQTQPVWTKRTIGPS
jgi:hypothetical protein